MEQSRSIRAVVLAKGINVTDDKWQHYLGALAALDSLTADRVTQQRELELSVARTENDVGVQLTAARARLATMRADAAEALRGIDEHLAVAGLASENTDSRSPGSGSSGSSSANSEPGDADPSLLLSQLRDLGVQIEAQGAILTGILRAQRRSDARLAELAERARARQAAMDEARREATLRREMEAQRAREVEPAPVQQQPVQQGPRGRSILSIIGVVLLLVVITVIFLVIVL